MTVDIVSGCGLTKLDRISKTTQVMSVFDWHCLTKGGRLQAINVLGTLMVLVNELTILEVQRCLIEIRKYS